MSDLEKYAKYAKRVKLFNGLELDEVAEIIKQGEILHYHEGATIFHQGQLGTNIFVVWKGSVGIYVDNDLIAKCEVGDAFGEMSALNHRPHSGSASALSDCKCFVLKEDKINAILQKHVATRFLLNIIHMLSGYLEAANKKNSVLRKQMRRLERASNNQEALQEASNS